MDTRTAGLEMKYFVVKPRGNNEFAKASRNAMRAYAASIRHHDPVFAGDLSEWVEREQALADKLKDAEG